MSKIFGFDIETYREHFCVCGIMYDSDTKQELERVTIVDNGTDVTREHIAAIDHYFGQADYIISFNGKRFDLPVLAKIKSDLKRGTAEPLKYIYRDAQALISYDANNNPIIKRHCSVAEWNAKHFDMLGNCLLKYSLKQWEMYNGLRIRELPYDPDAALTPEMKAEIDDYCMYDVWAMMQLFWMYGYDKAPYNEATLTAYQALYEDWPKDLSFRFDRTAQQIAAGIMYGTLSPIPPRTNMPLSLFSMVDFKVPNDIKIIIGYIAKAPSIEFETSYKGIKYGKGGVHFMRKGRHRNVYAFDFASLYPFIISTFKLLKTERANTVYTAKRDYRLEIKHLKKERPELATKDRGFKLFLNAPSGAMGLRQTYNTMYDPAAREAMSYIGQLLISELAFACPDFEQLLEINTDSVFVVGEQNIEACRAMIGYFKEKYGLVLEEEFMPCIYAKDVNSYIIYNEKDEPVSGRGDHWSDFNKKRSNRAVMWELFRNLIKDELDLKWDYPWTDFVVKYHRVATAKYAMIDGKPMEHKNYYFMWTTRECPNAVPIAFSRELIDRKNGAIKARFGVWSQDMAELEQYAKYIDYEQYKRDLDVEFTVWNREDLVTTHLTKPQRKTIKSLSDLVAKEYI